MTKPTVTRDWLYPNGDRPFCRNGDGRRVYSHLTGLCGDCFVAQGQVERDAEARRVAERRGTA